MLGRPKLNRCSLKLKQFDESVIKLLGKFESTIETANRINLAQVIVADCHKDHGLIGTDILKIDTESMIYHVMKETLGTLKGFKAQIVLNVSLKLLTVSTWHRLSSLTAIRIMA